MKQANQKEWKKSQSCPQEEDHQATSGLEELPIDISFDVLSRLPVTSLIRSKCVCRAWRRLIHDPRLPHFHNVPATESNPCIIFLDALLRNQLYFLNNDGRQGYSKKVTKIDTSFMSVKPNFRVVGSCNGLLCLSDSLYYNQLFIFNPFIGNHIELPKATQYMNRSVVLGFGFHPITEEYKVVRFVYSRFPCIGLNGTVEYEKSVIQIFTLGTDVWRNIGHAPYRVTGRTAEVLLNGALHWMIGSPTFLQTFPVVIVSFDLGEENFQEVPRPDCGSLDKNNFHLFDLGGCLSAAVYGSNEQIEIWVMKDYGVKESWTKQFIIQKYLARGVDMLNWRFVQVLCLLKNGEILLDYRNTYLLSYNPESEELKNLIIQGLPKWFEPVIHVGSLISAEVAFGIQG